MSRLICSLLLIIISLPVFAAEHILTPMVGHSKWSDPTGHTARGSEISFGDDKHTTYGFRYLYLLDNNFAFGGDIYLHDLDVATAGQADDAAVAHVHALAEYFVNLSNDASIFFGAGYGISAVGFSGRNLHDKGTGGVSYEINVGLLYRLSEPVGIQLEYKYTDFDLEQDIDSLHTNIESSSNSLLLGLTIHI